MECIRRILLLTCVLGFIEAIEWGKSKDGKCKLDSDRSKYQGKASVTVSGRMCVPWNTVPGLRYSLRNCYHNYCRNPTNKIQPWCYVQKRGLYLREYCDIPQRSIKPTKSPQKPEPLTQDTELTCGERRVNRISKIIGGSRSTVESQPWIAAIFKGDVFVGGGTLIAPCWVLTAAHLFTAGTNTQIKRYSVILGKNAINETDDDKEQRFKVKKLVIHENFNYTTEKFNYTTENYNHDIALLEIVGANGRCAAKTKYVRTACLPPFQKMLPSGIYCHIAGYGVHLKGGHEFSRHLKQAQVQLISQKTCQEYYRTEETSVSENMLCAAGKHWKEDACQGDSGGPLLCEMNDTMFLFGIISWGIACAEEFNPGVYTKVTNYNNWISLHTGLPRYTAGSRYPQKD